MDSKLKQKQKQKFQYKYEINFNVLKSLNIQTILRALTSKLYKSNKSQNYEQYQFIGDVVLKFLSTIQIFLDKKDAEEGQMHISRANLLCNSNLHKAAIKKKLFQYIFTTKRKSEPAPLIKSISQGGNSPSDQKQKYGSTDINVLGQHDDEDGYQYIPGKVHADAMESLIGAFYLKNKDLNDCQTLLFCFQILKRPNLHIEFEDEQNQIFNQRIPSAFMEFQKKIDYSFRNKGLLIQSLTHPTFSHYIEEIIDDQSFIRLIQDHKKNQNQSFSIMSKQAGQRKARIVKQEAYYERLQFLGDAVLDLIVVEYLYDKGECTDDEGLLTLLKQSAVSNKTLGYISMRLGLHNLILIDMDQINDSIKQFNKMEQHKSLPSAVEFAQIKFRAMKVLGDVFESLVGAIFVDTNFNYEATKNVVMHNIKPFISHFTSFAYVSQCPSFKYKEFLDQNNYKKIKIIKNATQNITDGKYLYDFTDKHGVVIKSLRAKNEKDAWDEFMDESI